MANEQQLSIIRQNQTQNVRELLKSKGWIAFTSTYEVMAYVELWTDYCVNGPTKTNMERFKKFDQMMEERISQFQNQMDGVMID